VIRRRGIFKAERHTPDSDPIYILNNNSSIFTEILIASSAEILPVNLGFYLAQTQYKDIRDITHAPCK
jgi:glycopeptide antibiotics resistance protein